MIRAVLDSSVLVSGWSRRLLQELAAATPPRYEPVWSEWTIAETWRVLTWRASKAGARWRDVSQSANRMLWYLLPVMHTVRLREFVGPAAWPELADANDEPLWAAAVLAKAEYVVSDNIRHFPPLTEVTRQPSDRPDRRHIYERVEYVTAIEFIEDVLGADATTIYGEPLLGRTVRSQRQVGEVDTLW